MNELQYLFNLICQRRGVALKKVESVELNSAFLANDAAFDLLPAAANIFYFLRSVGWYSLSGNVAGGVPHLEVYNVAGAGKAILKNYIVGTLVSVFAVELNGECSRLAFNPNGCTSAFTQQVWGVVYKITTA